MAKRKIDLREYRSKVAALKRAGLLTGVDARTVKPTSALTKKLNKYDDVISGKITPVKVSASKAREYKDVGYEVTKDNRVLMPHSAGQTARRVKGGNIEIVTQQGIRRIQLPIKYHDLEQYLTDAINDSARIDAMKRKRELFSFTYWGYQSVAYPDAESMLEELLAYKSIQHAIAETGSAGAMDQRKAYKNLEIFITPSRSEWNAQKERAKKTAREEYKQKPKTKKAKAKANARRRTPEVRAKRVEYMREYRAKMTPKEKAAEKKASAKRWRKFDKKK